MLRKVILSLIRFYQKIFSPDYGIFLRANRGCRFYPSCSEYTFQAIEKYGVPKGLWRSAKRVAKCHPWNQGGIELLEMSNLKTP